MGKNTPTHPNTLIIIINSIKYLLSTDYEPNTTLGTLYVIFSITI